jgi:hypothetical protein
MRLVAEEWIILPILPMTALLVRSTNACVSYIQCRLFSTHFLAPSLGNLMGNITNSDTTDKAVQNAKVSLNAAS